MSKLVHHYAFTIMGVAFALMMYGDSVQTSVSLDQLACRFTKESLRLQREYADSVKCSDIHRVYVFDNASYFDDATVVVRNNVRVKTKDGKFAVLSEAAQALLDLKSYKEFSGEARLKQNGIGYYI